MNLTASNCSFAQLPQTDADLITPVEQVNGVWLKRDDLFQVFGVSGGKARACLQLARKAQTGLVTAAARKSPQGVIVASIAHGLALRCRVHTAFGGQSIEMKQALKFGAELIQHRPGYNSVLLARSRADATALGWTLVPFGMESKESIDGTSNQVANIPDRVARLIVPVGSGMSLAAILWGLRRQKRAMRIVGVVVGADPAKRLNSWAPSDWQKQVRLVAAKTPYAVSASQVVWGDIALDPLYEAKCIPFLKNGDCLWVVGRRPDTVSAPEIGGTSVTHSLA